jgi:hypothetical protein
VYIGKCDDNRRGLGTTKFKNGDILTNVLDQRDATGFPDAAFACAATGVVIMGAIAVTLALLATTLRTSL